MQFMMPKAKLALSIAHVLLVLICRPLDPLKPFGPRDTENTPFPLKLVQLAFEMLRSSYTPAMKAPTKQRSMKETNMADSRVDLRRRRVTMAQTAPRTETMNRVLQGGISFLSSSLRRCLDRSVQDVGWGKLIGFCKLVDKVCLRAVSEITEAGCVMEYIGIVLTSMPNVGIRVMISRKRQKAKKSPAIIVSVYVVEGGLCATGLGVAVVASTLESLQRVLFKSRR